MSQAARGFTESVVEQAALAWLESLGYAVLAGPEIAPGEPQAERGDYRQVVLERRLRQALERLNPQFSSDVLEEAYRQLTRPVPRRGRGRRVYAAGWVPRQRCGASSRL